MAAPVIESGQASGAIGTSPASDRTSLAGSGVFYEVRILLVRIPEPVRAQLGQYCVDIGQNPSFWTEPTMEAAGAAMASADVVVVGGPVNPAELVPILPAAIPVLVLADVAVGQEAALIRAGVAAVIGLQQLDRLPVALYRHVENARTLAQVRSTEAELHQVQDRLRELIERVDGVVYEFDLATGRYTYVSIRAESMLGYPVADWLAPAFWRRMVHPEDFDLADGYCDSEIAASRDHTLEFRAIADDGRVVWLQDRGALNRDPSGTRTVTGFLVDITRVKEAEQTERIVSQLIGHYVGDDFFRSLVLAVSKTLGVRFAVIGGFEGGGADRVATVAVAADGVILDPLSYHLKGTPCFEVAPGTPTLVASEARAKYPGCSVIQTLGVEAYFGVPLFGSDARPLGLIAVMDDKPFERTDRLETVLSLFAARAGAELERRGAEAERASLQAQLVQAQKMEAIGTLAGGIAHDFNNILMGILGNAEMALEELASWHPAAANLNEVIRAGNRARDAVQRILTFSRKQEPVRRTVALRTIVNEAVILLRATLPSTIDLVVQPIKDAPLVHVDPSQVHQVLMNLATNAAHAIGNRAGTITLREAVVNVDRDLAATSVELTERRYLRLSVHDSGHGMDPVTLARIFEPFFTTKAPGEGTGLGLAVVHGIIEEHDGAILVESKVGQGTVFHLYFPALDRAVAPATGPTAIIPIGRGEHVLLVDDDAAIVRIGRRMLERLGYRVTAVESAAEALTTFLANPAGFDLVISDLTMPGKTGLELAREIKAAAPGIKFLLTTGHPDAVDRVQVPEIDAVLSKPFATARLGHEVDRILGPR